ncbi:AbiTii domain-containing protein [Promicromonospora soli]|uniref:AbiTii domain-containing protein n=1 Tax=Promicromonospora soli TaxID=2035533 RepID=A0A919KS42_9MICO|nr:hypothetical protein [Promicromonospora soli]GHH70393.1 hypothetical protein GCM10017772_16960 [Promicromonospora soli]
MTGGTGPGLLQEIERDALDSTAPLADVLRKCVALGGQSGSTALRDWARRELDGYRYPGAEKDLPSYRRVDAMVMIDGADLAKSVQRQQLSSVDVPEFARKKIFGPVPLGHRVAELERLAKTAGSVEFQDGAMPEVVRYMNELATGPGTTIHRMYWMVSTTAVHGVLDTIRTTLVALVAEMRAATPNENTPTAAVADQAVNVVVHNAKRSTINVNTNQSGTSIGDATSTGASHAPADGRSRVLGWIRGPWGFAVGAATIIAGIVAVAAWLNWNPFS